MGAAAVSTAAAATAAVSAVGVAASAARGATAVALSAAATQREQWQVWTCTCLFSLRPTMIFLHKLSGDTTTGDSPGAFLHCFKERLTESKLYVQFSLRLRIVFGRRIWKETTVADALATEPAWATGAIGITLEFLGRPGCRGTVCYPQASMRNRGACLVPFGLLACMIHSLCRQIRGCCLDIGDSNAFCHMTNGVTKMYDARPPHCRRNENITISDGTRCKVKQIGTLM